MQRRDAQSRDQASSQSIEWYAEGQGRVVEVAGIQISVRLVGRKGRRARIAITAPAGAAFRSVGVINTPLEQIVLS